MLAQAFLHSPQLERFSPGRIPTSTTLYELPSNMTPEEINAAWRFASLHGSSIGRHIVNGQSHHPYSQSISSAHIVTMPIEHQKQTQQHELPQDLSDYSDGTTYLPDLSHDPYQSNTDAASHSIPKSDQGVYQLTDEKGFRSFIQAHPDKLVIVKFYAGYCKACRSLAPKFLEVKEDPQLQGLPVVWAEFQTTRHSKDLFRRLGVLTLPTIHFYDGGLLPSRPHTPHHQSISEMPTPLATSNLIENFPCPPAKIKLFKKKLARFINSRVDPNTLKLKPVEGRSVGRDGRENRSAPSVIDFIDNSVRFLTSDSEVRTTSQDDIVVVDQPRKKRSIVLDNELIREEHLTYLRSGMPFFRDLTDEEFDTMIQQARLLTFNIGDVICKQGMPGDTFYVLKRGVVEMSIKSRFEDPIRTPPNYLGVVVGELRKFDYFGERALSTNQPLAASFRVVEKVRCFAFPVEIIPESSILSKKRRATQEMIEQLDQRYVLPKDYVPPSYAYSSNEADSRILDLLVRFKQIRQAARCFSYIMQTEPKWNDPTEIARRSMLVRKLSDSQRKEFEDVFEMVDVKKSGIVSLLEMRQFMNTARERKTDTELLQMIHRANPSYAQTNPEFSNTATITRNEFLGVMAEAEFYNLFTETFQELDREKTGYVRVGDLSEILGGVQELIADEKKINLIDVNDSDMLIDYEQFSKMLLGAAF